MDYKLKNKLRSTILSHTFYHNIFLLLRFIFTYIIYIFIAQLQKVQDMYLMKNVFINCLFENQLIYLKNMFKIN